MLSSPPPNISPCFLPLPCVALPCLALPCLACLFARSIGASNSTVQQSRMLSGILLGQMMPISRFPSLPPAIAGRSQPQLPIRPSKTIHLVVVCGARGPRPRFPRVWKTRKRIGTISKSNKLVDCIKGLSNVKEEVYGALDSFIAWELEFPLIVVKKALKTLETEKEWKRIIQVIKWMLSKGQGKTMGTYYTLLNAMIEDDRLEEAEELWSHLFSKYLESLPRLFFMKMISVYYEKDMHEKMFEIFADMEELGMRPDGSIVNMMGDVFQKLNMLDKYEKLKKKYPPPKWEYRYKKGKRIRIKVYESENTLQGDASVKALDEAENAHLNENREQ